MKFRILLPGAIIVSILSGIFSFTPTAGLFSLSTCRAVTSIEELQVLSRVETDKKQVSLLDLIDQSALPSDWKSAMSRVDVGEAPLPGADKYVDPGMMRSYLSRFIDSQGLDSSKVQIRLPDKIVVTRRSVQLSKDQIENIFRKFVLENASWKPEEMVIHGINSSGLLVLPTGEMTYEVVPNGHERFIGNVSLTVNVMVNGERVRSLGITGKVDVYQNVYHASRALKQNDVITPVDLDLQRINISDAPDRYVTQPDQALNKRLMRNVGIHQALTLKDLDKPLVLKRGDAVTIVYSRPGLQVTAKGQAKEDGTEGATIKISNVSSNRTVFCKVIDAQTVQATQ